MTTAVKLKAIDADAHVVESERTWDHLDPADEQFRPQLFSSPDNETDWGSAYRHPHTERCSGCRPGRLTISQSADID